MMDPHATCVPKRNVRSDLLLVRWAAPHHLQHIKEQPNLKIKKDTPDPQRADDHRTTPVQDPITSTQQVGKVKIRPISTEGLNV